MVEAGREGWTAEQTRRCPTNSITAAMRELPRRQREQWYAALSGAYRFASFLANRGKIHPILLAADRNSFGEALAAAAFAVDGDHEEHRAICDRVWGEWFNVMAYAAAIREDRDERFCEFLALTQRASTLLAQSVPN